MSVVLVALLSVGLFMVAFWLARVVPVARGAITVVTGAFAALRDPAIADDAREAMMRRGSLTLLRSFAEITLRSLVALAAAILPIYLADWAGIAPREAVFAFLSRAEIIAAITAAAVAGYVVYSRTWRNR